MVTEEEFKVWLQSDFLKVERSDPALHRAVNVCVYALMSVLEHVKSDI